jgi:quercetin dioxygenase-like cupin family protein
MIFKNQEVKTQILDEKSSRKILAADGTLMMVEVTFKKGGIGTPHSHDDHEQVSYIVNGSFEITVGGKTSVVKKGDGFYAGKNVEHGVKALEDGSQILDIFTPQREDFLAKK